MVAPVAVAVGKKAGTVAKTAARKTADDPTNAILIGVVGLVVVGTMLNRAAGLSGELLGGAWNRIAGLPGELLGGARETLGEAWFGFRKFGEEDVPNLTTKVLLYPSEATNDALAAAWGQSRSVVSGFWQGALDEDDPGPEYYGKVHYDPSGVPIAVPTEVDRTAKGIGRAIRSGLGDWSIPGF